MKKGRFFEIVPRLQLPLRGRDHAAIPLSVKEDAFWRANHERHYGGKFKKEEDSEASEQGYSNKRAVCQCISDGTTC